MPDGGGRVRVEADRADLVAERSAVEDHPEHQHRRQRDEDADVQALQDRVAPEHRQLRARDDVVGDRDVLLVRVGVLQRAAAVEQPDREPDRDPVEHDRRDHLVGARDRLQRARDARPDRAGQAAGDHRQHDVQQRRHALERRTDPDREDRAEDVLPLAADVEQAAAERERDREPGEDQRRRAQQRLLQVERGDRAVVGARPREQPVQARCRRRSRGRSRSGRGRWRSTTRPPTKKATTTVISGVMIPPPRRYVESLAATVASGGSSSSGVLKASYASRGLGLGGGDGAGGVSPRRRSWPRRSPPRRTRAAARSRSRPRTSRARDRSTSGSPRARARRAARRGPRRAPRPAAGARTRSRRRPARAWAGRR